MQELLKNKNKFFGLTGPIGCGKTKVTDYLHQKGAFIIDADVISRKIITENDIIKLIKKDFPNNIFLNEKEINRKLLGKLIFENRTYKDKLDSIMHPRIYSECIKIFNENKLKNNTIIYSAPLLLNSKYDYKFLDAIVVVSTSKEKCISRIIDRDSVTKEEAISRVNSQIPIEKQLEMADFVIDNNSEWENTIVSIEKFLMKIND